MKSIAIALLVAATSGPVIETSSGAQFEVVTSTAELSQNGLGANQASSELIFRHPDKTRAAEHMKVGVLGCSEGRGVIVLFDLEDNPHSGPHSWQNGGRRVFDAIAEVVCSIATARSGARSLRSWV